MSDIAIRVENLSKRYKIGALKNRHDTLRDQLAQGVKSLFGRNGHVSSRPSTLDPQSSIIWALNDVSFEIKYGEVVGFIGRNGAGKSTLLKILSRITEPTSGRAVIHGRVGSLLEVGTGFHAELTGRENIYLNGAILGMRKWEIDKRFDEIVAFAEIEKFIDTPVKRYSSGMFIRLAFAVAAHLEPEILIVDEVLAVGDADFQKKCLGKMGDVSKEGRTVLFVSHNSIAIGSLCKRTLLLRGGHVAYDGSSTDAISFYFNSGLANTGAVAFSVDSSKTMQIISVAIQSNDGTVGTSINSSESFTILINYHVTTWVRGTYLCLDIFNDSGAQIVWSCDAHTLDDLFRSRPAGKYTSVVQVPGGHFKEGTYYCSINIYSPMTHTRFDYHDKAVRFNVVDTTSLLAQLGLPSPAIAGNTFKWRTDRQRA